MITTDPRHELTPAITDEGLRCPVCAYNLTGLAGDVCPECGQSFDIQALRDQLEGMVAPIPIWDDRGQIGLATAFLKTCVEVLFHPIQFARRLPCNPDIDSAAHFSTMCHIVSLLLPATILLPLFAAGLVRTKILLLAAGVSPGWVLGMYVCEQILMVTLYDDKNANNRRGQVLPSLAAAHGVLSLPLGIFILGALGRSPSGVTQVALGLMVCVAVMWWLTLVAMFHAVQQEGKSMFVVVTGAVVFATAVASMVGAVVGFILSLAIVVIWSRL